MVGMRAILQRTGQLILKEAVMMGTGNQVEALYGFSR